MMEKHGVIREGLTPPEGGCPVEPASSKVPQELADKLLKKAEEHAARLEEHMTTRSHTRITENLK
jgi:hypothetical protein